MTQKAFSGRALAAGVAAASLMVLAGTAEAQQAYYFPQAGNGPVTVNYNALSPYAAPGYPVPGYQPFGAPGAQPRSVFTPQGMAPAYGAAAYGVPAYGTPAYQPVYAAPSSQFLPGQVTTGPAGRPAAVSPITYNAPIPQAPFVAPYANPYAPQQAGLAYPGAPQSYLNVPGQAPVALMGTPQPGAKPFDPHALTRKSRKTAAAPVATAETSAVEEAAAAQVAAVEAQLESGPPTPPPAPSEVPASVPSPAQTAAGAIAAAPAAPVAPAAPASQEPASQEPAVEAAPAEAAVIEPPAEGETQTASVEPAAEAAAPAEDAAAAAVALPAGAARLVFEAGTDDLPAGATGELDAIAERMMADDSLKVQVLAYSSASGENESQARRKALSRGLEVRKYLINKGVRSNRIDVRALGSKSEGGPADRVDIVPSAG
jgi:outer membrane protein OmpA-like peptidoglycan-associated protein